MNTRKNSLPSLSLKNKIRSKAALLSATLLFIAGCGFNPKQIDVKPKHEPVYNFTQSSQLLNCVGNYIDYTNAPPMDVYVSNIPDHTVPTIETGFLTKNAVMMVTTAIDRLGTDKIGVVGQNGGKKQNRQIQILGSFTELNRTTKSNAISGEAVFPGGVELELGGDQNYNHIALDLTMSENNRIVPGTSTSVAIQIHGNSGDVTLTYDEGRDFAAIGALGFTAQEGFHAAQRLLIETSVALMMSNYYNIDIRNCLQKTRKAESIDPVNSYDKAVFHGNGYAVPLRNSGQEQSHVIPLRPTMAVDYGQYYDTAPANGTAVYNNRDNVLSIDDRPYYGGDDEDSFTEQNAVDFNSFGKNRTKLPRSNGYVYIPRNGKKQYLLKQPDEYGNGSTSGYSGVSEPQN